MKTTCPHCQVHIDIDPETLAALQGHAYFQCPSCDGLVPVPLVQVKVTAAAAICPATSSRAHAASSTLTSAHRGLNRNLLIFGSAALLVLGGLAAFLASRKSGDTHNTTQNIRNEIINNSYFQNLIDTGATTMKDLDAVGAIRPYGEGFIGISKELLGWNAGRALAQRAGGEVLEPESFTDKPSGEITRWVESNFGVHLAAPVWIGKGGQPHILDGDEVVSVSATNRPRKVLLWWKSKTNYVLPSGTLHQGLVLHLTFDEASPPDAVKDSSGSNNHGKPMGVRWMANGKRGGAYEFTKDGDAIVVSNNPSLNPGKLTLAAWIKTSNDDGKWHRIFDKCFDQGFALSIGGQFPGVNWRGLIHFETSKAVRNGGYGGNITNNRVSDGQWHHVVATFDGIEQQIFVNGRFDSAPFTLNQSNSIPANDFDLAIGCNRSNSPAREAGVSFRGIIDEPMMWNRALSPEEVLLLYESFQ